MANIDFTRADLQAAAAAAQAKVGNNPMWQRAIERALVHLGTGQWAYYGDVVVLHSGSKNAVYHIGTKEPMRCSCNGRANGYYCWHIVAARLLVRAAEHHAATRRMAEVQAAADALYA